MVWNLGKRCKIKELIKKNKCHDLLSYFIKKKVELPCRITETRDVIECKLQMKLCFCGTWVYSTTLEQTPDNCCLFSKPWIFKWNSEAFILFSWGVFEKLDKYESTIYLQQRCFRKRYFSILHGLKDKTKSCRLCVVLLLQAAVPSVCFRVWHLPLGRENWHVSPFIADWFHCVGAFLLPLGCNLPVDLLKQIELNEISTYILNSFFFSF